MRIDRKATLNALASTPFDVAIVGGGITGAGIAREAALHGLRTALIERDDFASGTSSRSSRLVHGGVRYLEHGHLALVFESCRERRVLLDIAPHLVRPLAFTWPVYKGARVPLWKVRAGLTLYDALAFFRNVGTHEALTAAEVREREPALDANGLVGGARYWDAATDDTRLTLANALAAREAGAVVANHVTVVGGVRAGGSRLAGVVVRDQITQSEFTVAARVVVNATGPWSDATAALTGSSRSTKVRGSAGTHIAVPRQRLGNIAAITLVSPLDGRVLFVLPAGVHAIIGTTEGPANSGPDDIRATEQEVQYLLRTVNARFPSAALTQGDVISAWAGIRPLAAARTGTGNANAASREHDVSPEDSGLLSVTGGKLTTYRAMAVDVVSHVTRALANTSGAALRGGAEGSASPQANMRSDRMPLPGGDMTSRDVTVRDAQALVRDHDVAERLALAYGTQWRNVWRYVEQNATLADRIVDDLPYVLAEVPHAVERELACTIADVLLRRTHVAFETRDHGRTAARRVAPIIGKLLEWSATEMERQLTAYDAEIERIFTIDPM